MSTLAGVALPLAGPSLRRQRGSSIPQLDRSTVVVGGWNEDGLTGFTEAASDVVPFAVAARQSAGTIIGGLVIIVVLVVLVAFAARAVLRKLRSLPKAASPDERALWTATNSLDQARVRFKKELKEAEAAVSSARRRYVTAVSAAEKRVAKARTLPCLGRAGRIKVYEDRIVTSEGVHPMDEQVKAVVEAAGVIAVTRRHTLTRFALLGPFSLFTPKATTHDNRELIFWSSIRSGPRWSSSSQTPAWPRGRYAPR
jgi:hypothetical protein